ncbi:MAG: tetratricopeptide repeat protein [Planctomycetota bacterium]
MSDHPTLDLVSQAMKDGDLDRAGSICDGVIAEEPDNARAYLMRGVVHAQNADFQSAVNHFHRATQLRPDAANYHFNLALAYQHLDQRDQAIESYRDALACKPDFLEAQNNLGNLLIDDDQPKEGVEHFRKLAEQFPDQAVVQYNLANVLQDAGEYTESIDAFRRAIELDPDFASARENLGRALSDVTRYEEAAEVWREWLQHEPGNPIASHMLAALGEDEKIPDRCNDDFVRGTFDENFAKSFDDQLNRLNYRVPQMLMDAVADLDDLESELDVLDAGCGTGLCAVDLRQRANRLVGLDLSPEMLEKARAKKLYDELVEAELSSFLKAASAKYDLIVCGDTLCYFGELESVLESIPSNLKPGGHFLFTLEYLQADEDGNEPEETRFRLQPNGRYSHREPYLRDALADSGLSVNRLETCSLRMERGRDVTGFLVDVTLGEK